MEELVPLVNGAAYAQHLGHGAPTLCYLRRIEPAAPHWLAVVRLSMPESPKNPPALIEYAQKQMPADKLKYDRGKVRSWISVQRAHMRQRPPTFYQFKHTIGPIPEMEILDNAAVADENGALMWMNGLPFALAHEKQEPGSHWHVERYRGDTLLFMHALEQGSCRSSVCLINHF